MEEMSCYRNNCSTAIILKVQNKLENSESSKKYEIDKKLIFSIIATPKMKDNVARYHDIYIFCHKIGSAHKLVISSSALKLNQKMNMNSVHENSKRWICERYIKPDKVMNVNHAYGMNAYGMNAYGSFIVPLSFSSYIVDITLSIETSGTMYLFKTLYTDEIMTDFELLGDNGSVRVHRAILAEASPVLYTMLSGDWKESKEGRITISGITQTTLQDFKNYIYLNTLPVNNLEPLMMLASLYMMPELEHKCGEKLLEDLRAENTWKILQFALENNFKMLGLNVLKCIGKNFINVDEIGESILPTPTSPSTTDIIERNFQYTVNDIGSITEPAFAPSITCNGLVWNFFVKVNIKNNRKQLGIYISCNGIKDAAYWMCAYEYEMTLLNLSDQHNLCFKGDHIFHSTYHEYGIFVGVDWDTLMNPSMGYVSSISNSIKIKVRIVIAEPHIIPKIEDVDNTST